MSQKISRRDWFRLRIPRANESLGDQPSSHPSASEAAQPNVAGAMQPIDHPPNHDGMDLSDLPPMREAMLSSDDVEALFRDVEQLASDVLLMQRSSKNARAQGVAATSPQQLRAAKSALLAGETQRIQIRYRWQDSLWIDTLQAQPSGFRIVRIAHESL